VLQDWKGFDGHRPVRVGNAAAMHRQFDVFGEMVLALSPFFLDARFREQVTPQVLDLVKRLAREAIRVAGEPDAGIWEYRERWKPQTFSSLMCWAAADRMGRIARLHGLGDASEFEHAASSLHARILEEAVDPNRGNLIASAGSTELDAALLQAIPLRFLPPGDPRLHSTIAAIREDLDCGGWLRRYRTDDGFGVPTVAFTLCTFWLAEALACVGRAPEARALLERVQTIDSPLGLLSEDLDPKTRTMWGNYPQAYSHAGFIHAAFSAAPAWAEIS
jgi:GH15 family glucan-1,4-alpha-glucosidase